MDQNNGSINWDKMLEHLNGRNNANPESEPLNKEELEMLLLAEEMHIRLQGIEPDKKFPVEQGWKELQLAYQQGKEEPVPALSWWKRNQRMAIAAVLTLCLLAPALWLYFQHNTKNAPQQTIPQITASVQIKLTLANGEVVNLDSGTQVLKDGNQQITVKGSNITYKQEEQRLTDAPIKNNILEVPLGKQTKLVLSDGTQVWVNAGSKLSYPSHFDKSKREVTIEGEAFFQVAANAQKPFIVQAGDMKVNVLGTEFNVSTFDQSLQTALLSGKVNLQVGDKTMMLLPGQLGTYNQQKATLSKQETNIRTYTAWKDNELYFYNASLREIAARLEREYNLTFNFADPALANLHFTIDLPKTTDVLPILNNIKLSTNQLSFTIKGREVSVKKR